MKTFREFIAEASEVEIKRKKSLDRLNQRRELAKERSRESAQSFKEKGQATVERGKAIASAAREKAQSDHENMKARMKAKAEASRAKTDAAVSELGRSIARGAASVVKSGLRRIAK